MSEPRPLEGFTLVIPCFNEALRLDERKLLEFAGEHPALRWLLVDDGSTDDTWTILQRLRSRRPDAFDLLRLPRNLGKAEAVRRGMLAALREPTRYVGYWDADLATPLEALLDFSQVLEEHPAIELAIGSRVQLLGRDIVRHAARHYVGRAFATLVSLVLHLKIYDSQCGAKIFRVTEHTEALFRLPFRTRWIFDVELLARLIRLHRPPGSLPVEKLVYEMPLKAWHDVRGSRLRKRDFARAVVDLARVYLTLRSPGAEPIAPALRGAGSPAGIPADSEHAGGHRG